MTPAEAVDRAGCAQPVLIAGPTASGKSALALEIAARHGGVIVNADALQVFSNWHVLTARPDADEQAAAPHRLYGHIPPDQDYSVGHWLHEVSALLDGPRPIIVGGTGLYFTALTGGLAHVPQIAPEWRDRSGALLDQGGLPALLAEIDTQTAAQIDRRNPARVRRAWEVLHATGRGLAAWQQDTPPPRVAQADALRLVMDAPRDWLTPRIATRFDKMLAQGALDEVRANLPRWDPARPASRAIGAPELVAYLQDEMTLPQARARAIIATTQYAKRQRTWFRSRMKDWPRVELSTDRQNHGGAA